MCFSYVNVFMTADLKHLMIPLKFGPSYGKYLLAALFIYLFMTYFSISSHVLHFMLKIGHLR